MFSHYFHFTVTLHIIIQQSKCKQLIFLYYHVNLINENKTPAAYVRGAAEIMRETVEYVVLRQDHLGKRHWGLGKALRNRPPRY